VQLRSDLARPDPCMSGTRARLRTRRAATTPMRGTAWQSTPGRAEALAGASKWKESSARAVRPARLAGALLPREQRRRHAQRGRREQLGVGGAARALHIEAGAPHGPAHYGARAGAARGAAADRGARRGAPRPARAGPRQGRVSPLPPAALPPPLLP